jgi:hypothetical protein
LQKKSIKVEYEAKFGFDKSNLENESSKYAQAITDLNQQIQKLEREYEQAQAHRFQTQNDFEMILKSEKNKMESEFALKNQQMDESITELQNKKINIGKEIVVKQASIC